MIPKVIHYCWFGGNDLPQSAVRCIESWKKYFPDYEIIEWNEQNYNTSKNKYIEDAYKEKKYAFVSDFARFDILYNYGGVYFDVDVEVIKDMSCILMQGPFMGCERRPIDNEEILVNPGLGIGAEPQMSFLKQMLDLYNTISFYDQEGNINQKTIVMYTTEQFRRYGLTNGKEMQHVAGFNIYPWQFFCPMDARSGRIDISDDTYTIHYFLASWHTKKDRFKKRISSMIGPQITSFIVKCKALLKGKNT